MEGGSPPLVDPAQLLERAAGALEPQALGALVGVLADWLYGGSRRHTLRLLVRSGLHRELEAPDFIEGLGARRLKSKQLVRLAFATHRGSPGGAVRMLEGLVAAGAVNVFSSTAVAALHAGMAQWARPEPKAALVTAVVASMDTFAQAGLFLSLLLECPSSALEADEAAELLGAVLSDADVRDLAGDERDVAAYLPDHADVVARTLLAAAGEGDDDASEADDDGNLAGFVDDDIVYDTGAEEEEGEEEGDNSGSESGGSRSSGGGGGNHPRGRPAAGRKRQRPSQEAPAAAAATGSKRARLLSADTADSSVAAAARPPSANGLKRLRRQGALPPPKPPANPAKGRSKGKAGGAIASRYVDGQAGVGAESSDDD